MASDGGGDRSKMDVLVVDDAPSVRTSVRAILEDLGVTPERIHEVDSARDALIFCDGHTPDLVLLDLVLPDIPGEEVGSLLMEENPNMLVVPMTALDPQDGRVRQLVALGAFDLLEKPIRQREVEALFEELSRESHAPA